MPTEPAAQTLEVIEQAQLELFRINSRFLSVQDFATRLDEITRGKPFRIRQRDAWHHMLDARDMVVVHLASWGRSLMKPGGFWGRLKGASAAPLYFPKPKRTTGGNALDAIVARNRREAFEGLFPEAAKASRSPQHGDIDALKDRADAILRPAIEDRDKMRAHPYEKDDTGTAAMLTLEDLKPILEKIGRLLNRLRLVVDASELRFPGRPPHDARDLVLLVLFGSLDQLLQVSGAGDALHKATGRHFWQFRDHHLDAIHEAATSAECPHFNDSMRCGSDESFSAIEK